MKKILLILIVVACSSNISFAQMTGGGSATNEASASQPASDVEGARNYTQFCAGFAFPIGIHKNHESAGKTFRLESGFFFHDKALLEDKLKFGMNITWFEFINFGETTYLSQDYNIVTNTMTTNKVSGFGSVMLNGKIGLIAAYQPIPLVTVVGKANLFGYGLGFSRDLSVRYGYPSDDISFKYCYSIGGDAFINLSSRIAINVGIMNNYQKIAINTEDVPVPVSVNAFQLTFGLNILGK
jgi:hypothetical protein